jgi:hypothetical protein
VPNQSELKGSYTVMHLNWIYKTLIVFFLIFASLKSYASAFDTLNGLRFEAKGHYGVIYPHNTSVYYLLNDNLTGVEFSFSTGSKNRHAWEELYRNPQYGIAYNYSNLGNTELLGNLHALFAYLDIPFYRQQNKCSFTYHIDFGLGYTTKRYHAYDNPLNHLISSQVNVFLGLDLTARFKVGEQNELKTGFELSHVSNGKIRTPNLGINAITLSAAWLYSVKQEQPSVSQFSFPEYRKHYWELLGNIGGKRDDNMREDVFLISSFIFEYHYAMSAKYAVGTGLDFFYDAALSQHREFFGDLPEDNSLNYQNGVHVGIRARYNRLHVLLNIGHYIKYKYLRTGKVYSRVGVRYALSETILFNLTLKAHNTVADYIEWGVGYRFKTNGL